MPLKADEQPIRPVISLLAQGVTGTGKTVAACGKEFRPVYAFMNEGRMESVITYYKKLDGHVKDVEYDYFHMNSGFYPLDKRMDELANNCPYKTVLMSTLTSYIHIVLAHLIKDKAGRTRQSGQKAGKQIGGIPVNELEDFNAEDAAIIFEMCAFLQQLKAQGTNVILEAHISPYEVNSIIDGKKESTTVMQILTKGKKAPAQIPGYFNEVYLFEKKYKGFGQNVAYTVNPIGDSTTNCKTSMDIEPFDWTGKDFSVELMNQLSDEVKSVDRRDPNAPSKVKF